MFIQLTNLYSVFSWLNSAMLLAAVTSFDLRGSEMCPWSKSRYECAIPSNMMRQKMAFWKVGLNSPLVEPAICPWCQVPHLRKGQVTVAQTAQTCGLSIAKGGKGFLFQDG